MSQKLLSREAEVSLVVPTANLRYMFCPQRAEQALSRLCDIFAPKSASNLSERASNFRSVSDGLTITFEVILAQDNDHYAT